MNKPTGFLSFLADYYKVFCGIINLQAVMLLLSEVSYLHTRLSNNFEIDALQAVALLLAAFNAIATVYLTGDLKSDQVLLSDRWMLELSIQCTMIVTFGIGLLSLFFLTYNLW